MRSYYNEIARNDRSKWFRILCEKNGQKQTFLKKEILEADAPFGGPEDDDILLFLHWSDWHINEKQERWKEWCKSRTGRIFVLVYSTHPAGHIPDLAPSVFPPDYVHRYAKNCTPNANLNQANCIRAFTGHLEERRSAEWSLLYPPRVAIECLLEQLAPLDILIQGALVLLGAEAERNDLWWWCEEAPGVCLTEQDMLRIRGELANFRANPLDWFSLCAKLLKELTDANDEDRNMIGKMSKGDLSLEVALRKKLLPQDGSVPALLKVIRAVALEPNTDILTDPQLLKKAHAQFLAMAEERSQ